MNKVWQKFWSFVWHTSEYLDIPLHWFGDGVSPWVFHQMIGADSYERVDNNE